MNLDLVGVGLGLGSAGGSGSATSADASEPRSSGSGANRSILASDASAGGAADSNMTVAAGWFGFDGDWSMGLAGTGLAGSSTSISMSAPPETGCDGSALAGDAPNAGPEMASRFCVAAVASACRAEVGEGAEPLGMTPGTVFGGTPGIGAPTPHSMVFAADLGGEGAGAAGAGAGAPGAAGWVARTLPQ